VGVIARSLTPKTFLTDRPEAAVGRPEQSVTGAHAGEAARLGALARILGHYA